MTKQELIREFEKVAEERILITATKAAKLCDYKSVDYFKKDVLEGLDTINKRYFVRDVVNALWRKRIKGCKED